MFPGYWGIRRVGYFLSLLWLWVNGGRETLCLERTGTGIVFREISRPDGMLDGFAGCGLGSDMRPGL